MSLLGNLFGGSSNNNNKNNNDYGTSFDVTPNRRNLKTSLQGLLLKKGFTRLEIKEIMDVITLAEADIKIAEDSLAHVNVNNPDPTRAMHAALEDIRRYKKEMEYNVRKKIFDILARKRSVRKKPKQ